MELFCSSKILKGVFMLNESIIKKAILWYEMNCIEAEEDNGRVYIKVERCENSLWVQVSEEEVRLRAVQYEEY